MTVYTDGFEIRGRRYSVGDVLCHPNQNIKGIILFGFYDNGLDYEDHDYGCGFYIMKYELVDGHWAKDEHSIESIPMDFYAEKETNQDIIREIRNLESGCGIFKY